MPAMPKDMSWLSPKRRRTTGNLKNVTNAQVPNGSDVQSSPPQAAPPTPPTPTPDQRPKAARPVSQPQIRRAVSSVAPGTGADSGNLFYAYARKVRRPCESDHHSVLTRTLGRRSEVALSPYLRFRHSRQRMVVTRPAQFPRQLAPGTATLLL